MCGSCSHTSLLPPQDGFPYLPHGLGLRKPAVMEKPQVSFLLRQLNLELKLTPAKLTSLHQVAQDHVVLHLVCTFPDLMHGSHIIVGSCTQWYLHPGPRTKFSFHVLGDNTPWGTQREGREKRTPEYPVGCLSGCCEDRATQTRTPHFCHLRSAFSCPLKGEGRSNMPSTDQILLACIRHLLPVYLKLLTRVKYTGILEPGGKK